MTGDRFLMTIMPAAILGGLVLSDSVEASNPRAGLEPPAIIKEISADYTWGWRTGLKQPLGSYLDGWSIHQITQSNVPQAPNDGNPDNILWVDENTGTHGIAVRPTGTYEGWDFNAGGRATFAPDGHIWYTWGGRATHLPLDLFVSDNPFDVNSFSHVLDDFSTQGNSTAPTIHIAGDRAILAWRHGSACCVNTRVRTRFYEFDGTLGDLLHEDDLAHPIQDHPKHGDVGIEQFWTRYDPRFGFLFASWLWNDFAPPPAPCDLGSSPFLYHDGETWRGPDHSPLTDDLPLAYTDMNATLMPFDHLANGLTDMAWSLRDIGITPNGTFFITLPSDDARFNDSARLQYWHFADGVWNMRFISGGMLGWSRPHALAVTLDKMVALYSDFERPNVLKMKVSADDGLSWSDAVVVDIVPEGDGIGWVSLVQPAVSYEDNHARFFYGHHHMEDGNSGLWHKNKIKWVKIDLDRAGEFTSAADLDLDGVVGVNDLLILLGQWGSCGFTPGCYADLDGDDSVDSVDLLALLRNWG